MREPKNFLGLLFSGITVLSSISGVSAIDNQQKVENNQTDSEKNLLLKQIKNSDSFESVLKGSFAKYRKYESSTPNSRQYKTEVTVNGINRIDIVFKAKTKPSLINNQLNQIKNLISEKYDFVYAKNALTFSIAYKDLKDFKNLLITLMDLKFDSKIILQITVHDTSHTIKEWREIKNDTSMDNGYFDAPYEETPYVSPTPAPATYRSQIDEDKVWDNYFFKNQRHYKFTGFNKKILKDERIKARDNWDKGIRAKVGVYEAVGIINKDANIFSSNDFVVGSGIVDDHANIFSEIIVGRQGLNPYATIYSEAIPSWNGKPAALDYFVRNGVKIINNSWGSKDTDKANFSIEYNDDAIWLDNFLLQNPEVIFIEASGNDAKRPAKDKYGRIIEYKTPAQIAKYLEKYDLSYNSIVIGAVISEPLILPKEFSEYSMRDNYVSASTPDDFETGYAVNGIRPEITSYDGTSMSAPTVSSIASLLTMNYKNFFDKGDDSLIFKSALIAGSRTIISKLDREENHDVYNPQLGFGRVNFAKVKESLEHMEYARLKKSPSSGSYDYQTKINVESGKKYRVNITWANQDSFKTGWVSTFGIFGHDTHTHIGPIDVGIFIYYPFMGPTISVTNYITSGNEEQKANTKTIEFTSGMDGWMPVTISNNDETRKKELDVVFTYSEI
ncbi:S8 family serine peptidase [Mycoplasmopsis agassizii]|nr:S8 family serine peptidase [Mycoplasmopsis agassizii]